MTDPKLKAASDWIIAHADPQYIKGKDGYCARAVREAVKFGFNQKDPQHVESAKDYGPSYEKFGFKKVFSYPGQDKSSYVEQVGDIAIIQYEPNGHICMFAEGDYPPTGKKYKGWVSDFLQRDLYGGKHRDENPPFTIYRYASV